MAIPLVSPLINLVQRFSQSLGQILPRRRDPIDAPQNQPKEFFLDPDEAKTLGNVEYMRTPRTVRKTFPKIVGNKKETLEIIESVSAVEKVRLNEPEAASPTPESAASSAASTVESSVEPPRRRPSDDLNPWRSMAREIRKSP